jgi:hypothetical protein
VLIDVMVRNQNDEKVATGEAMVEFPADAAAGTVFTSNLSHADRKRAVRERAADHSLWRTGAIQLPEFLACNRATAA